MFTHVMIGINDPEKSHKFYDEVLGALGLEGRAKGSQKFYSKDGVMFMIGKPLDGNSASYANGGTIGFDASSKEQVDAFHLAGLANGGSSEGLPGKRPLAPGNAYGAYLRDPDGNKICAFCQLPEGV